MNGLREFLIQKRDALFAGRETTTTERTGNDLHPGMAERQLDLLGSCLTHNFLVQAADRQVSVDAIEVDVTGQFDPRAGQVGAAQATGYPSAIQYTVRINSPASDAELTELRTAVEQACPPTSLLVDRRQISGAIVRTTGATVNSVTFGARAPFIV